MRIKTIVYSLVCLLSLAGLGHASADDTLVRLADVRQPQAGDGVPVVGYLLSKNRLTLSMPMDGTLTSSVAIGTQVSAGDVVATLDDRAIVLAIEEQKVVVTREEERHAYFRQELARLQALDIKQHTSKIRLAEWTSERDQAGANHKIALLRLRQLRDERERMKLRSPVDGIVFAQERQAGEYVGEGDEVVSVVDNRHLEIVASVPVRHRSELAVGTTARISADTFSTTARLDHVLPISDPAKQQFEIRLSVEADVLEYWTIGHLLSVEIPLVSGGFSKQVPREAILRDANHNYVLVASNDETVREVEVRTGRGDGAWVAVNGDLQAGDQVVVRGGEGLKSGASVRVLNR